MTTNPFGDDPVRPSRPNPFGEDEGLDPMRRLEGAPARLRGLRARVGAEGMTGIDMRQLLDELAADIDAVTRLLAERA
ncbi:MAG TPA: hypothetical protein VMN78_12205 [Longimicrobiales bacterium]|nr:hypothetical protein [Longimicrobiales bacterium]